jgi:hypothetical protein
LVHNPKVGSSSLPPATNIPLNCNDLRGGGGIVIPPPFYVLPRLEES